VSRFVSVVCIMPFSVLEESVHYLTLDKSNSCFKSIQTRTGSEETMHWMCFSCSRCSSEWDRIV